MSKKYAWFISILFCGFLTLFLIAHILLPDRDFSPEENRNLKQFPALSLERVTSGTFMEEFETYFSEQFAGRDFWIGLKAASERLSGKQENNGVYFGTDGETLFPSFEAPSDDQVDEWLGFVNQLGDTLDVPVYFALIPGKVTVLSDLLPYGAPNTDELSVIDRAKAGCSAVTWIDMTAPLLAHKDEYVFYRTDHHWTTLGAWYAYQALMDGMGLTVEPPDAEPELVSDSFYGTTYSSAGAKWIRPDEIWRRTDDAGVKVTSYFTGLPEEGRLYVEKQLTEKDKYAYFLGGNQPLCVIETENTNAPKVLLIRDSYSDCLAPYLTASFSEIHLWDLRYNNMSLKNYVAENGIDQVVVLYSTANFCTDYRHLFKLGL